jgi:L-ascorbate metabolism protein UlaG (beta-lactamase superfamily)
MTRWQLRSDVRVAVEYADRTPFGSPVRDRAEFSVREIYSPLFDYVRQHGFVDLVQAAPALLADVVRGEDFGRIAEPDGLGAWRIRPEVLWPDIALAQPAALVLERKDSGNRLRAGLPSSYWPLAHALIAELAGQGYDDAATALHPDMRAMLEAMQREGLVEALDAAPGTSPELVGSDLTFVGHNTVIVRAAQATLVVDPYLFAGQSSYPDTYQPLQLRHIGPVDAVLITHSHPDHFDPGSLIQFPPDTRVIVPYVERETMLAVAMARRLRELGFTRVSVLEWGQATLVDDIEVHALPFYGEQPTDGEVLHPAIRNAGNIYLVRTPNFSAAFLADSGRDGQGDVKQVASRARANLGPIDVVFAGYRGWLTYPVQHLFSSVGRFLLFVPPWLWSVRQRIMIDADDAVDVAERWEARYIAGYADGGAPWHWNMGLGPRLDDMARESPAFDPFPERLVTRAETRSEAPDGTVLRSPVRSLLLRPGDSVRDLAGSATVVRLPGHAWPYGDRLAPAGELRTE